MTVSGNLVTGLDKAVERIEDRIDQRTKNEERAEPNRRRGRSGRTGAPRVIDADRFPLAPRLRPLKSALAKLDPPATPPVEPLPLPIAWVNSTIGQRKRRR